MNVTVLNTTRPDLVVAILTLCAGVACVLLCAILVFAIKKKTAKRVDRDLSPEEATSAKTKPTSDAVNKDSKDYQV